MSWDPHADNTADVFNTSMKERCTPQTKPPPIFIQKPPYWGQMDTQNCEALLTWTEVAVDFNITISFNGVPCSKNPHIDPERYRKLNR